MKDISSSLSRREFLTAAMSAGGGMLLGPARLVAAGEGVDTRVAQVMSRTIGIDMHNHVYPAGTEPPPQNGQPRPQEAPRPCPGGRVKTIRAYRRLCELRDGFRA